MVDYPSIPDKCQDHIRGLAKEPINIVNLPTKEDDRHTVFIPRVHFTTPVFRPLLLGKPFCPRVLFPDSSSFSYCTLVVSFCLAAMAPRVDLVARKAMEAVAGARKVERKKKR